MHEPISADQMMEQSTLMNTENLKYSTDAIARYFSSHRVRWDQFYESERVVIAELGLTEKSAVLDVGCGCGGLGLALHEKFGVTSYTGVEINRQACEVAKVLNPVGTFLNEDILDVTNTAIAGETFETVFSLSCVDWNVCFTKMLKKSFNLVAKGGRFVASFRLTDRPGLSDLAQTYQFINYDGVKTGEIAAYVVLNLDDLLRQLFQLPVSSISAYGYWGSPGPTAVTPYDRLCFAVFVIEKAVGPRPAEPALKLRLPPDLMAKTAWAGRNWSI